MREKEFKSLYPEGINALEKHVYDMMEAIVMSILDAPDFRKA